MSFPQLFKKAIHQSELCAARDLKLENTLLDLSDPPTLKIGDFGLASGHTGVHVCQVKVGTPEYMVSHTQMLLLLLSGSLISHMPSIYSTSWPVDVSGCVNTV